MKRYRLLKDLPGVKAGTTLRTGEQIYNELYNDDDGRPTGYRLTPNGDISGENPLLHSPASDWLKEIPEDYKRWRAGFGDRYWFISNGYLGVTEIRESGWDIDNARHDIGNYFKTEKEANKAVNWLKAFAVLRDDAKGFKPDWEDSNQDKWYVLYNHSKKELTTSLIWTQQGEALYFATQEDADASIKNHEHEWLTYFGVEE